VATAIVGGPASGAGAGFICGIVADLFVNTPFGLTALVFSLVGFGTGSLSQALGPGPRGAVPVLTTLASATAVLVWAALGTVLGLPGLLHPHLILVVGIVASVNAAVSMPLSAAARWVFAGATGPAPARRGLAG
jgi:rod shape-determining protein MreD